MLADLSGNVTTLDTEDHVQPGIRKNLTNIHFETGSINDVWQEKGNFDVILLNGSVQSIPEGMLEKLNAGGRLFAVVGEQPAMSATLFSRSLNGGLFEEDLFETSLPRLTDAVQKDAFNF